MGKNSLPTSTITDFQRIQQVSNKRILEREIMCIYNGGKVGNGNHTFSRDDSEPTPPTDLNEIDLACPNMIYAWRKGMIEAERKKIAEIVFGNSESDESGRTVDGSMGEGEFEKRAASIVLEESIPAIKQLTSPLRNFLKNNDNITQLEINVSKTGYKFMCLQQEFEIQLTGLSQYTIYGNGWEQDVYRENIMKVLSIFDLVHSRGSDISNGTVKLGADDAMTVNGILGINLAIEGDNLYVNIAVPGLCIGIQDNEVIYL